MAAMGCGSPLKWMEGQPINPVRAHKTDCGAGLSVLPQSRGSSMPHCSADGSPAHAVYVRQGTRHRAPGQPVRYRRTLAFERRIPHRMDARPSPGHRPPNGRDLGRGYYSRKSAGIGTSSPAGWFSAPWWAIGAEPGGPGQGPNTHGRRAIMPMLPTPASALRHAEDLTVHCTTGCVPVVLVQRRPDWQHRADSRSCRVPPRVGAPFGAFHSLLVASLCLARFYARSIRKLPFMAVSGEATRSPNNMITRSEAVPSSSGDLAKRRLCLREEYTGTHEATERTEPGAGHWPPHLLLVWVTRPARGAFVVTSTTKSCPSLPTPPTVSSSSRR